MPTVPLSNVPAPLLPELRATLVHTEPPADPTDVVMPPGSQLWPEEVRERLAGSLIPAGVLVPVIERPGQAATLLLTERSAELKHHAGQISFPGGRMEADDADIVATALRETHEEVGIHADQVVILGYLAPMPTISGYAITPVIGQVDAGAELVLDRAEVASTFEVPVEWLLDPANRRLGERFVRGRSMRLVEFHYAGHRIWGATAFILLQFLEIIKKQ
ncbi:MAG: CoA pyrophosphatase [Gammaproteobacteria bacterium]|nr:CoA pyrophosphatase [Gammaproteobacteria bacterium]